MGSQLVALHTQVQVDCMNSGQQRGPAVYSSATSLEDILCESSTLPASAECWGGSRLCRKQAIVYERQDGGEAAAFSACCPDEPLLVLVSTYTQNIQGCRVFQFI